MIYFGIKLSKHLGYKNYNFEQMFKSFKSNKKGVFLTLGTKIGVGSIIGTTMAIFVGGPGCILWVFIFSILTSSIIYYESLLGSRYKKRTSNGYVGGPYFYLKYGLKSNLTAIISTGVLVICYSFFFQMIQTNTVSSIIKLNMNISPFIIMIGFLLILVITVFFSIKELLKILNKLVPFMCLFFVSISIYILIKNSDILLLIMSQIFRSAFSLKGILIGALIGIKRSVFLNEVLIGTTSIASSVDETTETSAASAQILGMYFITFVVSFLTSLIVLIFKYYNNTDYVSYNDLINKVFNYHYGVLGGFILIFLLTLLATSTIISGFYIGLSNLNYVTKNKYIIFLFKIFVVIFTISGIFINESKIWDIIDTTMVILIIINIISISMIYRRTGNDR